MNRYILVLAMFLLASPFRREEQKRRKMRHHTDRVARSILFLSELISFRFGRERKFCASSLFVTSNRQRQPSSSTRCVVPRDSSSRTKIDGKNEERISTEEEEEYYPASTSKHLDSVRYDRTMITLDHIVFQTKQNIDMEMVFATDHTSFASILNCSLCSLSSVFSNEQRSLFVVVWDTRRPSSS